MRVRPVPAGLAGALAILIGSGLPPASARPAAAPYTWQRDGGGDEGRSGDGAWLDIVLPRGFHLDLTTGLVTNRVEAAGAYRLRLLSGALASTVELRRLRPARDRTEVRSVDGEPAEGTVQAQTGLDLLFALPASDPNHDPTPRGPWGLLRVVSIRDGSVQLEYVRAASGADLLRRSPARLDVRDGSDGLELSWPSAADGGRWRVSRAVLGDAANGAPPRFSVLAEVDTPRYLDRAVETDRVFEYRVERIGSPFGVRRRAVREGWAGSELVSVDRGAAVSLLSGRTDGVRIDVKVDFANPDGVQLSPGRGCSLKLLTPAEEHSWTLPAPVGGDYPSQRMFAQVGRSVAVRLPEGIYARLRVVRGAGTPRLGCQLDVDGGRLFPQPPVEPEAHWTPDGVEITARATGGGEPEDAVPSVVVEREDVLGSEEFAEVLEGAAGAARIVDAVTGPPRLVRYRFRHRMPDGKTSPPSPPVRVLLLDDAATEELALLVADAIRDLGADEFERRQAARATLEHLGARALDGLRGALSSEDPEVVGAATEILAGVSDPAQGSTAPARLVLRARAEARGLAEPPGDDLLADSPLVRSCALLRLSAADPAASDLEAWRALIAEVDPDPGTRLVASYLAGANATAGAVTPVRFSAQRGATLAATRAALDGARTRSEACSALAAALDRATFGHDLVLLTHLFDLARNDLDGALELDELDRLELALALIERYEQAEAPVFLEAALRLVDGPGARLAAARAFADARLNELTAPPPRPAGEAERRVERLPVADSAALSTVLRDLSDRHARDVDLVLPAGVYEPGRDTNRVRIAAPGLRIIAEGEVVIQGQLGIDEPVVFERITFDGLGRPGLSVNGTTLALVGCKVRAGNTCIVGDDAQVLLSDCVLDTARGSTIGVRLTGQSALLARGTVFDTEGTAVQGPRLLVLERCTIDAGRRNGIDGMRGGSVYLIDTYVESESSCLSNLDNGVLDGALLSSPARAAMSLGDGVAACSEHLEVSGGDGAVAGVRLLDSCPLGRGDDE